MSVAKWLFKGVGIRAFKDIPLLEDLSQVLYTQKGDLNTFPNLKT